MSVSSTTDGNAAGMAKARNPIAVTFAVWHAMFLREALDRLFDMRAAWLWLFLEPILHIGFLAYIFTVLRVRSVGGMEVAIWIVVGLLGFFLFRRTGVQVMHAVDSNRAYFTFRQVKPFDAAIVRAGLEGFLMSIIAIVVFIVARLLGYTTLPVDPLLVLAAAFGLWLCGLAFGLVTSVLMRLVPELKHIFTILMLPLYLISGVIWPLSAVPEPYRSWLLLNPIAHGLEEMRSGFADYYYAVPSVSLSYLYTFAIVGVLLGLMLYRRFNLRLVMQ